MSITELGANKLHMEQESTEARPERLASFLLSRFIDIEGISIYQREILSIADVLRDEAVANPAIRQGLRNGMEEALRSFETLAGSSEGTLLIRMPVTDRRNQAFNDLVDEFAVDAPDDGMSYRVLGIPCQKITATKALSYLRKPDTDNFEPVLTMRVIGQKDVGPRVYSGAGQITELPSDGTWHQFSLMNCEFLLVNE